MKFDFNNMIKIKSKTDLYTKGKLKYPIDIPLHTQTYLHHILINLHKIKIADEIKLPIYLVNSDDMDGIMLASSNQDLDTLKYLLIKYEKYIYNTNNSGNTWVHLLEIEGLEKLYFDKSLKHIEWNRLFKLENNDKITTIDYIFSSNRKKFINHLLNNYYIKNPNSSNMSHIFSLFDNYNFSTNEIIKILNKFIKNKIEFKRVFNLGLPCHYSLLLRESKEIIYILYKYKESTGEGTYGYLPNTKGSHSLFFIYNKHLDNKYVVYFFDKFEKYLNLSEETLFNDNILIAILGYQTQENYKINKINDKLFKILNKLNKLHTINDNNQTILHYIVMLPFKEYLKYHKFLDFSKLNTRDKDGNLPIDYTNEKKWISKLEKLKEYLPADNMKLNIIESEKAHSTIFKAYIEDIGMYFYFLKTKYPRLYIPNPKVKTLLRDLAYDGSNFPAPYMESNHEFAWVVIYQNEDTHYIHPYIDLLLKGAIESGKYDYSCLLISIKNMYGGLHATPLFINHLTKQVIRWDSFGLSDDASEIDNIIKTNIVDKIGFDYVPLYELQNIVGIQEKSKENESNNMKRGDFGGFCVAWTIWFIEHNIINNKITPQKLVKKLEKLIFQKDSPVNYIRNYSNYLFESIKFVFKKNNWNIDEYTNETMPLYLEGMIIDFLMENL